MSSNRRSYAARKKRGGLTRTEHLQLAKKRGQLGTFRQDAEANRQLQKEFAASGAYTDARHDKSIRKSDDPKFMGSTDTVGGAKQITETETKKMSPYYLSYPIKRSASEQTGDTFLIKCIEYTPPKPGMGMGISSEVTKYDMGKGLASKNIAGIEGKTGEAGYYSSPLKIRYDEANTRMSNANHFDKKTKFYVELPIPQELNDSNSVTWGEDSLNIFQLAGLAAANNVMRNPGNSFQKVSEILQKGIDFGDNFDSQTKNAVLAGISGAAINALGGNVSPGSVISRSTGQILNSNLELLFQGVNLRSFPFSVTFSPRNAEEAKRVKMIIRHLKQTMAPKTGTGGGGPQGVFLKSPDVFSLRYLHNGEDHPFLNTFKLCALTGLNVNYTNAGTYASYEGGTPVNIRMNMTFKELNPIYNEDYNDMSDEEGVGF
tara:strand:+ start:146 stop:1438 length:1293 start_codon:yes stop_codon:yes gene_type:complete